MRISRGRDLNLSKQIMNYISFKFQIDDKPGDKRVPMFEFGHHISRVYFSSKGANLLTDHEKVSHMEAKGFKLEPFKWYEVLAEVGVDTLFVQIKDEAGKIISKAIGQIVTGEVKYEYKR